MVATATDELPLTYEGTHCVDAVECWATRLGGGTTFISICNSELKTNRDMHMKGGIRPKKRERKDPKVQIQGMGELGESPFNSNSKHITQFLPPGEMSYSPLTCSQFCHFSQHFFCTPFTGVSAASTRLSSCPWGLIPLHQFVQKEDILLPFIHPSATPKSNLSDLLSGWHLTPVPQWHPVYIHGCGIIH